jgi:hypothetical protein
MSGIQEAVRSSAASASAVAGGLSVVAEHPSEQASRSAAGALSKVAWIPQGDLGQAEWLATGRRLGAIGRCSQWWIGDWIRYGSSRWGEKYAEAARITGYDVASLRNMAWVASQFDLSLRSDKLTWSHHVLLAPLEADEKRHWLDRAEEERLSVADLRIELRGRRQGGSGRHDKDGRETAEHGVVCPNCGHEMRSTPN